MYFLKTQQDVNSMNMSSNELSPEIARRVVTTYMEYFKVASSFEVTRSS